MNLEGEIFKDIVGYEGKYQISNLGRVKSLARTGTGTKLQTDKILKHKISKNGYCSIGLSNKQDIKWFLIHRLVAFAFIPVIENKNCVNHKDGNKKNNNIENLEWCTHSENNQHSYNIGLSKAPWQDKKGALNTNSIPVIQYDKNNNPMKEWSCAREAMREINVDGSCIIKVCRGKRPFAGGFIWKYKQQQILTPCL